MFDVLNEKQIEAVKAGEGPLLIVAGAGSGKTKTLTARLAFLIKQGIAPERILAITFTNKAADEMKRRVREALGAGALKGKKEPFVGTFHSFGAYLLRTHAHILGRTSRFSIYDDDDSLRLAKYLFPQGDARSKKASAIKILKEISRIKNELLQEEDVVLRKDGEDTWRLYCAYEAELREQNAFDFDDLITKVVHLLKTSDALRARYQSRYDYILVDEYQDVNTSQYMLVKLLAAKHQNVNVVGDDQQAIYRFRFSDFRNFLNFERDWPSARVVFLEQNYRSTKNIIISSSALIAQNTLQKTKELWTENDDGKPVGVVEHHSEYEEAAYVAMATQQALERGQSVGILYRTNAQSRALEQMFLEHAIPYNLFGAVTFYERKEVKDIIAMLRYVNNPKDKVSAQRIEKIFGKRQGAIVLEMLLLQQEKAPHALIEHILKKTDYLERLEKEFLNYQERVENIQELARFSSEFSLLENFLEKVLLAHPFDARGAQKKKRREDITGANMMTIHLAKGLEFDVVFVVGVNEGLLPHQRSLFSLEDVEEERRLMYVAMTRARKELALSFWGTPSRFLSELPGDRIEFVGDMALNDEERYIEYD